MVPPLISPAATASAPRHITSTTPPNTSRITTVVMLARSRMRRRAVSKVFSTTPAKRSFSRCSCPKLWTIFIAESTSVI